ncbi:asparagine synthase C-terminal domain-containing protein [Bacteroides sp.]|uniref:asparagine synthase-related protein n=1 Tax=Bacteroides sp. TaxID=29523 RepID=UPI00260678F4|nr:asparagine synthase C-terminal domain-containing protein [Bacteroides sp.]
MIYGKLSLKDWRTTQVMGDEPESVFESADLRLFFYGILYNRDILQSTPEDSDAKIAAVAYASDPVYGFSRLDGSFTIVYYAEKECGIVRDHHGTHYPVYCTDDKNFSTSWQFLQKQSQKSFSYNPSALSTFLQRGILKKGFGGMSDVSVLEAGERFHIFSKDVNILVRDSVFNTKYKVVIDKNPDIESYSHRYGELHKQAIRRRIGDSNRVGILLSGGYDSGSNLAALRSIYDGQIDSYSVGFKGDTWTELPMARLMSDTFDTRHHEYEIDGSEINALPEIVRFLGEPFVEGGLMVNYCAMRMIGDDKPEVILGGDGSDQYFGTSGREVALRYLAARTGMRPLLQCANKVLSHERFDTGGKLSRINFHLDKILHVLEGERFGFSDSALCGLLQNPKRDFLPTQSPKANTSSFESLYTQHAIVSDLEIVINRIILYKASRMSQMFGNNLTFPFMDLDLYNFLQDLPVGLKCKGNSALDIARGRSVSKYLLKYHYKPLLPEAITSKKKQGGFAPMPLFFRDTAQRKRFKEFILASSIMEEYLRRDMVEKFLVNYDREEGQVGGWFWHKQNKALQYFNLLTLVVWWEEFVVGKEIKF